MGRRKKGTQQGTVENAQPAPRAPEPDPPRPNRPLLLAGIVLTVLWIACLIALAALA